MLFRIALQASLICFFALAALPGCNRSEDCKRARECKQKGQCGVDANGVCRATNNHDCRSPELAKFRGNSTARAGQSSTLRDIGCRSPKACGKPARATRNTSARNDATTAT